MTTQAHHLNRTTRTTLVLLLAAVLAGALTVTTATASSGSYNWPIKPFDREHPVRGNFGDPRTLFNTPPTTDGALSGGGSFQFHFGVDISAPDGTPVYPVASGTVVSISTKQERVNVSAGDGRTFEYWHIAPAVRVGARVTAAETVLGRVVRGAKHVHLTELHGQTPVNPAQVGHLTPYSDHVAPRIRSISIRKSASTVELPNFVRGSVDLVVDASDTTNRAVPGIWAGLPVGAARLAWRVDDMRGHAVVANQVTVDITTTIPSNSDFWNVYERGTYQNMSVFGTHYSYMQPGRYLYRLAPRGFDTRQLKDGVYDLVVTAMDIRGNSARETLRFTVHNGAGWSGS